MRIAFNPSTVAALTSPPDNKDITFDLRGHNIFARGVKFYGTDTNTWRDIKINNVSIGSHTLDLRNGSNTTLTNTNGVVTINSTQRPVVDNLTSNSTTSSLSANQGRVLAGLINGKSDSDHNHDGRYVRAFETSNNNIDSDWGQSFKTFDPVPSGTLPEGNPNISLLSIGENFNRRKQLAFIYNNDNIYYRRHVDGAFSKWRRIAFANEIPTSVKNPYSLTTFGVVYDGSTEKVVSPSNFISQLREDTSVVTDGTMFITSYASNSGFADTNAVNVPYKRKAARLWDYIKAKTDTLYSTLGHNHDNKYLRWFGNAGQFNMNAIGRISHSSGMTNLGDPKNTTDNPMEGNIKSTSWHLYWQTNYTDNPGGSNAWVAQIVNRAGTDRWWVRSRSGGTITNGTGWTSNWRFLVTAPTSGLGNGNQPVYINSAGEVVAANSYPTSLKSPHSLTLKANGTTLAIYDGSSAKEANFTYANVGAASASHTHSYYAVNENYGGFKKAERLPISGFYQSHESESGGNAPWKSWMHLINCQHSNTINNCALQIAASFYDNNTFKIRVTNDNVNNAWRDIIHSGNIGSQSVNYANSAGNADTVDGYHATDGRTFNGIINWGSWGDAWSDGTNKHPWYGFDHRYPNTGAYSTTISDFHGMTIKTANNLRLDFGNLLLNGTSIYDINVASATKVIVQQHTSNDTDYPLVWSNQPNTNNVTEKQLYKSWADLYYNPKNKRLSVGGSIVTSFFIKNGGTSQQLLRADGGVAAFNWSGQSGQPTWLWGGNDRNSYYVYNPSNFRVAYASTAGNAETLGGMPRNYGQAPFSTIPCIGGDGIMEIGRCIDYHYDNSGNYDFSTRLQITGSYKNVVSLPSASGTLALVSQVLTWKSQIIDMRSYSESYWHPVTVPLPYTGYNKIKVSVQLNSGDKPSWATHKDGITCNMEIWATASGWGTTESETICLNYTYRFCSQNPCGWMQLTEPTLGVVFLRGGSRYTVYTDFDATFTPHNQKYTWSSGSYSQNTGGPHTSCPGLNFTMGAIRADLIATMVQARRVCAGHDPGIDNSISCSNWFRSSGNTGWYNTTYQGGWYMSDTSWIRAYNNVGIYTGGQIYAISSIRMGDIHLEYTNEINNITNGCIYLNYRNSGNVSLCRGGGNVGIGTVFPNQKLDVNGNITTRGFGIQPYYIDDASNFLPTISPGDGYTYRYLEISSTTNISCVIASMTGPPMGGRGVLVKFNKGYDGQIVLLKELKGLGGYLWTMPSGCKILRAITHSFIDQNQIVNIASYSRFLVYSSAANVWIEFFCSP